MAEQYDNTNRGVLFLNDRKTTDKHPDRKGSINIDGKEYWLSGWNKQTSKGDTISLSVEAKDAAKSGQSSRPQRQESKREASYGDAATGGFEDDAIPFAPIPRRQLW
jgi:hypothetical protein